MIETADPDVVIEQQGEGFKVYQNVVSGVRWKVSGTCDRRGDCWVGGILQTPSGPIVIETAEHYQAVRAEIGDAWIDSQPDVPVGPGFEGCCPLSIEVLTNGD